MVFSSTVFLCVFLPVTLMIYYACPKQHRNWVALVASLIFYSWGAPQFVAVLAMSSLSDYIFGKHLAPSDLNEKMRKKFMVFAIAVNVVVLAYFKYMNFFVDQIFWVMEALAWQHGAWVKIALPIGISFFTFQKISYLVDVYRGIAEPAESFHTYFLYVSLFPQLIAGPIVRYHDISHQLVSRNFDTEIVLQGFWRFATGLGKKVLIANALGEVADHAFAAEPSTLGASAAWLGAFCYSFQIYFDFSGYSDMAIGIGRMLGFRFLENFNFPYISKNFTEFWGRWHISLSNWMKEYLYIPLGGNRRGRVRNILNLWFVFLLSGLWHGAAWNFLVWGAYHGFFLSLDKVTKPCFRKIPEFFKIFQTFILVTIGWVCFRLENISDAWAYVQCMFTPNGAAQPLVENGMKPHHWLIFGTAIFFSFAPALIQSLQISDWTILDGETNAFWKISARLTLTTLLLTASFMALVTTDFNPFIYFRF